MTNKQTEFKVRDCLVTGGAGFIGSHLAERLIESGHRVRVIDNMNTGRRENLSELLSHPAFELTEGDIRDKAVVSTACDGVDWVFHLAGLADVVPSVQNPTPYFETNVNGTFNLLNAARKNNVDKFVYAASSSCYGVTKDLPTTETTSIKVEYPYALTKRLGEELALHWGQVYGIPVVSLRLFNVFGPRARTQGSYGSVLGVFLRQKLGGEPFTVVGDGSQSRDFIYVTDVVNAFASAAMCDASNIILNIGAGQPQMINRLVELLDGPVINIPKRPGEPDCTHADITRALELLDWRPEVSFEEGISLVLSRIDEWSDAPLWTKEGVDEVTRPWFELLS